jgi:uncharacterized protein (TIGR02186 family)
MNQAQKRAIAVAVLVGISLMAEGAHFAAAQAVRSPEVGPADGEARLQIGISVDTVPVSSEFSGQSIAVFGTIEDANEFAQLHNEYGIAIVIRGPDKDVVVRRKERAFGIWVNRQARYYRGVPSFYSVASNRLLKNIAERPVLRGVELGVENITLNLFSAGTQTFILPAPEFAGSLRRIRLARGLFAENPNGVVFLGSSLFRATMRLPADVPIGRHTVSAYLFRNGELLDIHSDSFEVRKVGLEKLLFAFAHSYGLLYGIFAVLVALATGWLASVVFGGNRT